MQIRLAPENFKTRETAHTYLKEILHLPDYYGRNLDALYDCLMNKSGKYECNI